MPQVNTTCPLCHVFVKAELRKEIEGVWHSLASCEKCDIFIHSVWKWKKLSGKIIGHHEQHKLLVKWGSKILAGEILKLLKVKDKSKIIGWFLKNHLRRRGAALKRFQIGEDLDLFEHQYRKPLAVLVKEKVIGKWVTGNGRRKRIIYYGWK